MPIRVPSMGRCVGGGCARGGMAGLGWVGVLVAFGCVALRLCRCLHACVCVCACVCVSIGGAPTRTRGTSASDGSFPLD